MKLFLICLKILNIIGLKKRIFSANKKTTKKKPKRDNVTKKRNKKKKKWKMNKWKNSRSLSLSLFVSIFKINTGAKKGAACKTLRVKK